MQTQSNARLVDGALNLADFLFDADPAHGGEVLFAGRVRNVHEGRRVSNILYHAHRPLAEARLAEIEAETERRFDVRCRLAHAVGELAIGEISVIVRSLSQVCSTLTFTFTSWIVPARPATLMVDVIVDVRFVGMTTSVLFVKLQGDVLTGLMVTVPVADDV